MEGNTGLAGRMLLPGVLRWAAHNPDIRVQWACHAIQLGDGGWLLIDPIGGPEALGWASDRHGKMSHVMATNGNHERLANRWAGQASVTLWAAKASGLADPPWRTLPGGGGWIDGWVIEDMTGGGLGEVAVRIPSLDLVVLGDAVVNLVERGLELLPDPYCTDPRRLRESLCRLTQVPFQRAVFAHGEPILKDASQHLRALLG